MPVGQSAWEIGVQPKGIAGKAESDSKSARDLSMEKIRPRRLSSWSPRVTGHVREKGCVIGELRNIGQTCGRLTVMTSSIGSTFIPP